MTVAAQLLIVGGAVAFAIGLVAAARGQPYRVLLLLQGFLATVIPLSVMPAIRKRYENRTAGDARPRSGLNGSTVHGSRWF